MYPEKTIIQKVHAPQRSSQHYCNSQDMKANWMSSDGGVEKEDVVHNTVEPYSAIEWNNAFCSNTDGPRDYHTKWSESERERQISWYPFYEESKIWYK